MLYNSNCDLCDLHYGCKTVCMPGRGAVEEGKILFVGESPNGLEDNFGRPLVGNELLHLTKLLRTCGVADSDWFYTKAVKCRPPKDRTPGITEVRACRPYLEAEIRVLKPRVVICLGATAAKAMANDGKLTLSKAMGPKFVDDPPTYAVYAPNQVDRYPAYEKDFVRIVSQAISGVEVNPHPTEIVDIMPCTGRFVAVDLETYPGLDPWHQDARIRFASMSSERGYASIVTQNGWARVPWLCMPDGSPREWKCGSNIKFDLKWLATKWYTPVDCVAPVWDTAVAERLLNPECLERGLKALVLRYAPEMGRYDAPVQALVQERGGKEDGWARIADEELIEDGAMDADGSLRVAEAQYARMDADDLKLMGFYSDLIQHLTRVEIHGIRIDTDHLAALEVEMGGAEGSVALAEARLWGKLGCDPNSPLQVKAYFGTPDAQKATLEALNHPLAAELLEYKKLVKLYSTYVKGVGEKQHDGILHTDFRVDGTSTGRLSGRNPNLQNIAKVARIKAMYLPDVGCVLYEIDYSQAEIRLVADMANDQVMLADLAEGVDFHLRAAQTMYEKQKITDEERFAGKATTFLILYGGNAVGLSKRIGRSVYKCRKLINNYYQRYKGLHRWQFAQIRSAKDHHYVSTRFGRKYRFPAIDWDTPSQQMRKYRRIAVNAPVQGSIGQITQMAEMAIERELLRDGYQVLLQVHDSVLVSVPLEEHESGRAATRLRQVCESLNLTEWGGPLRVPLKVDIKWGPNWGSMTKLKGELSGG